MVYLVGIGLFLVAFLLLFGLFLLLWTFTMSGNESLNMTVEQARRLKRSVALQDERQQS